MKHPANRTRRKYLTAAVSIALLSLQSHVEAQAQNRISLPQLEEMFATIRNKTKWNIDGPLLWSYFFYDPKAEKLAQAGAVLKAAGYTVVGVRPVPVAGSPLNQR